MLNYYYSDKISDFLYKLPETIIGEISLNGRLGHIHTELYAWEFQIELLKAILQKFEGHLFFEFSIPRMGKRVDCLLIIKNIVFVIEFKVGDKEFFNQNIEQVWDYALDLKNFHKPSHSLLLVPILVATQAKPSQIEIITSSHNDNLVNPLKTNADNLGKTIYEVLNFFQNGDSIDINAFVKGSYLPTPTIIEAAISLYNNHNVAEITRNDERYGIVVSSQAYRLKPLAIDVKTQINHVNWFLDGKDDIRSSYFLEDVATEFQVQGLELDWAYVTWDGDLRYTKEGWKTYSFVGNKWQNIHKAIRQKYLINAYRVLLTRARQGMVIVIPEGNINDHTRHPDFYNSTFNYLKSIGFKTV